MANWFPIGPDFVFTPRDPNFQRLSRRNELGRQGLVNSIAIDPADPGKIYTCETPTSGGNCAFRTDDGCNSWNPIVAGLQSADPGNVNPSCVAVHPNVSGWVYLATFSGRIYVSPGTKGDTWNPNPFNFGSGVFKLIVDPRDPNTPSQPDIDPSTTVVYAACSNGVWRSADGGASFVQVLAVPLSALAARMPTDGSTADFYAGATGIGVYYSSNPTNPAAWTNLTTAGVGLLPQVGGSVQTPNGNFDSMRIDCCRLTRRVYVLFFNTVCNSSGQGCNETTAALCTSVSPTTSWSAVPMTAPPNPVYGLYDSSFAVAANSASADGSGDILFFGGIDYFRSIDGGRNWQDISAAGDDYHNDYHAWAFYPDPPPPGTVPVTFQGVDGGLGMSTGLADPTVSFPLPPGSFDETGAYGPSPALENLNHGKQSSAVYTYNSDPAIAALGYIGVQDTGINAGDSALMWRGIRDFDGGSVACTQGADGVKLWHVVNGGIGLATDKGEYSPAGVGITYAGASGVGPTSNFMVAANGNCLAGLHPQFPGTTIATPFGAGVQTVAPGSMANIVVGTTLTIDASTPTQENVVVTAVSATAFTASFANPHAAGASVSIVRQVLGSIDQGGVATPISQDFGANGVGLVAVCATDPSLGLLGTGDQRVFSSGNLSTANPTWTEATVNKPGSIQMASLCIDRDGNLFVLLTQPVTTAAGGTSVTSPLFLIAGGTWVHLACSGTPTNGFNFARIVADPVQSNTLYAAQGARVFALTFNTLGSTVTWTDISGAPPWGLPGQWIYDLWIGNIGTTAAPRVLLRAAIPTRGIWEADVTAGAKTSALGLYLRDNLLDLGHLPGSPDGLPNPYNPTDTLYHYQCADIKIDALQLGTPPNPDFFQTDPEGTLPLSHVWFDQLRDNSDNLPSADQAMVHVQVRNRGTSAANNVRVWTLYANAGAGLPSLPSGFWNQFTVLGDIVPAASNAPWQPVGAPVTLNGIDPAHPQVASWNWTVPTLPSGDPGHYCVIALVHSSGSPINESGLDVDVITPTNRQIGQKNLHIGPPLPAHGSPRSGGGGGGGGGQPGGGRPMREYIDFHNPSAAARESSLVFDLRGLPPQIRVSFALTKIDTATPLPGAITGIKQPGKEHPHGLTGELQRWLDRIEDELEETTGELLEWIDSWLERTARRLEDQHALARHWKERELPRFERAVYTALPSARVEVRGVNLASGASAAALLSIQNRGSLPEGSSYTFHVQQWSGGKMVGGSAYVVRIAGVKSAVQPAPSFEGQDLQGLAPYIVPRVEEAKANLGKS
jgi:hypothetical protein